MVVHIYSLSEWNVELSSELQSHSWLSSASNTTTTHDNGNPWSTTTTTTTTHDPNNNAHQHNDCPTPFSVSKWLNHSIKTSPSVTICRYNYCHPMWQQQQVVSRSSSYGDISTEQLPPPPPSPPQESIRTNLQSSIQHWLQQRRQLYRTPHSNINNNNIRDHRDDVSDDGPNDRNDPPLQHPNDDDHDYIVTVQSHAIFNDTLQIIVVNTATCHHSQQQYDFYTSRGPPPLSTWYVQSVVDDNNNNNNNTHHHHSSQMLSSSIEAAMPNDAPDQWISAPAATTPPPTTTTRHQWRKQQNWPPFPYGVVIIDRICGEAILRGADIHPTTGILCTDTYIVPHSPVAVYVDVTAMTTTTTTKPRKVSRGMTLQEYSTSTVDHRSVIFIGIGVATCTRSEMFTKDCRLIQQPNHIPPLTTTAHKPAAIRMVQIATPSMSYLLPPTNEILSNCHDRIVVQNLPSLLVAHTLLEDAVTITTTIDGTSQEEEEVEWILDMCCAPGGKTSHLASLVSSHAMQPRPRVRIIACDKSQSKVLQVRDTLRKLHCDTVVIPLVLDTTKCVLPSASVEMQDSEFVSLTKIVDRAERHPDTKLLKIHGFPPESFHRILLDPPCSAWGLRPKLSIVQTKIEQLQSVGAYQRQFIQTAIRLLAPGGVMTYSTCTIHTGENESMVRYILDEYPMMELIPILHTPIGGPGWLGFGLTADECQSVRRFDPTDPSVDDSIGFFVAKFRKQRSNINV